MTKGPAKFVEELRAHLAGEVRDDLISKTVYSVDASIYEIPPLAIVLPLHRADMITAMEIACAHDVAVIPRGAATGIAGGCIGHGLVIDTSKYLNKIKMINFDEEYAICEPGVVQNQLNQALASRDYRLGPDTSTGNRATLGGMLANNSAGARSLRYGRMCDHIQEVELILATGEVLRLGALDEAAFRQKLSKPGREGDLYRQVAQIKTTYAEDIATCFPRIPRRASGYSLEALLGDGPPNLAKLIAGSEGSLGLVAELRIGISRRPQRSGLCLLQCASLHEAFSLVTSILAWQPLALEMVDRKILAAGRSLPLTAHRVGWIAGDPAAVLIVEFDAPDEKALKDKLDQFAASVRSDPRIFATKTLTAQKEMEDVWAVRESGLGLLLSKRSYSRAIAFIEDFAVSPDSLAPFMEEFQMLLSKHNKEAGIYGHVGAGCMHVRPYIDLRKPEELKTMRALIEDTSDLILKYHGSLSGEHGDGLVRSWLNEKMFGKRLYQAFLDLKRAFDPDQRMNPGKVIPNQAFEDNRRMSPDVAIQSIETVYDFSREGGFELAIDLCNGNGLCRKREGLMCPSFQADGDEFHSTRARAQSLRAIVNGRLSIDTFTSKELYHVLEYCLECKGCKTECPSQVDMAKMKAEFLHHYQQKWGASLRSKLFGSLATTSRLTAPFAPLFNAFAQSGLGRKLLKTIGIAPERPLPSLARERFSRWLLKHPQQMQSDRKVVLFVDTFTEFHHPEIGQSALRLLNALGCEVILPSWSCCGRPLISKGFLEDAKRAAKRVIDLLLPYAEEGLPILGLEPSCLFTLKDEYPDLLPGKAAQALAKACVPIDVFLSEALVNASLSWKSAQQTPIYLHTHCHQKALLGSSSTVQALKAVPHFSVQEITSGCCGLAGSFGYEAEHYEMSMQIGESRLFPAVRSAEPHALIIANGISCRSQILHGTARYPLHLVQALEQNIDK